jgi:hypothetical protein
VYRESNPGCTPRSSRPTDTTAAVMRQPKLLRMRGSGTRSSASTIQSDTLREVAELLGLSIPTVQKHAASCDHSRRSLRTRSSRHWNPRLEGDPQPPYGPCVTAPAMGVAWRCRRVGIRIPLDLSFEAHGCESGTSEHDPRRPFRHTSRLDPLCVRGCPDFCAGGLASRWGELRRERRRSRFMGGCDVSVVQSPSGYQEPENWVELDSSSGWTSSMYGSSPKIRLNGITVYEYRCSNCETAYIAPAVGAELTCGGRFFERLLRPGNWPLVYKLSYLHPLRRAAGFSSHRRYSSARRTHDRSRSL